MFNWQGELSITDTATIVLIHIIGAVALLLWGTRTVKRGFTRAYGASLQNFITANTKNRFRAVASGFCVAAVLQSSAATALMVSSFASQGLVGVQAGLAMMIGADVASTIIAQILIFDLSLIMPVLLAIGVFAHKRYEHQGYKKHIASAIIGLGLILLSLSLIRESAAPLARSETLLLVLEKLQSEPLLAILISAVITFLLHSSLAMVLLIASLISAELINLHLGVLLIFGANLGSAAIPYVMSYHMGTSARRIATGNLIMRASVIFLFLPVLGVILGALSHLDISDSRMVINIHTAFNCVLALIFIPFLVPLTRFSERFVPDSAAQDKDDFKPYYLDETTIHTPAIALSCAARETLRVANIVEEMFVNSVTALHKNDLGIANKIEALDDRVDELHDSIKIYLTRLNEEALDPAESNRFLQILNFSTNLEHIGDVIESSLLDMIRIKAENKHRFSDEGYREIKEFQDIILNNIKIAHAVFMSQDPKLARKLIDSKAIIRNAAQHSLTQHFKRLRSGDPGTVATRALHTDLIRDYRRINTYITSVAYTVLEHEKDRKKRNSKIKEKDLEKKEVHVHTEEVLAENVRTTSTV